MRSIHYFLLLFPLLLLTSSPTLGQSLSVGRVSGSFQSDVQYLFEDPIIGADDVEERVLSNTYMQLTYQQGAFTAGLRYEAFLNPLLGYDTRYEGQGIANRYFSYNSEKLDVTAGNFYDQFGNGLIFRSYWAWALGIDNSIDGVRMNLRPRKGIQIKGILGKQRNFFELGESLIRGADVEVNVRDIVGEKLGEKTYLILGASVLNKFQEDEDAVLQLPENVSAFSGRFDFTKGRFNLNGEYAYKINDPISLNDFVYNPGNAFFVNTSFAQKGIGYNLTIKRSDNFDFRSQRDASLQALTLNFIPPGTRLHTYRLPTLYPYATQFNGELGFQGTIFYRIPKKTKLGGKYGTLVQLNFSRFHGLDKDFAEDGFTYNASFLGDPSDLYFQDINVEINHKWSKTVKSQLTYIWLLYNKDIIEFGSPNAGFGIVNTHIGVLETQFRLKKRISLRTELQHMYTRQDLGSWVMALAELSISPHGFISIFDEWNYGNPDPANRVHYYNAAFTYVFKSNRIALSYARQRRGLLCVGGICREVPASNGFNLSVSSTF